MLHFDMAAIGRYDLMLQFFSVVLFCYVLREVPMKFSVLIPAYNRENYIAATIESVLAQTYGDFEIVVVDDASTDRTVDVVRSFTDKRVNIYLHKKNTGQIGATKTAYEKAKGEIITLLDSDDLYHQTMLEKVKEKYDEDNDLNFVYVYTDFYYPDGSTRENTRSSFEGNIYRDILKQGYLVNTSGITCKYDSFSFIEKIDSVFSVNCSDDIICFTLAKNGKAGVVKEPLSLLRVGHPGRVSQSVKSTIPWIALYTSFKDDIIKYCGTSHYTKLLLRSIFRIEAAVDGARNELALAACKDLLAVDNSPKVERVLRLLENESMPGTVRLRMLQHLIH